MKWAEAWAAFRFWLRFFFLMWRPPERYRKLFRDISSCYLTPGAPGKATVAGIVTECVTNKQRMIMLLDGCHAFYIDRAALTVRQGNLDEDLQLWDWRVARLRKVFEEMIRSGVPYPMSGIDHPYKQSDVYGMKVETEQ